MKVVVCPQQTTIQAALHGVHHTGPVVTAHAVGICITHAQGIENSGDTRSGNLGIMGQQGGEFRPLYLGPWHQVPFKVVSV